MKPRLRAFGRETRLRGLLFTIVLDDQILFGMTITRALGPAATQPAGTGRGRVGEPAPVGLAVRSTQWRGFSRQPVSARIAPPVSWVLPQPV